jgi:hypothetical protein
LIGKSSKFLIKGNTYFNLFDWISFNMKNSYI